MSQYVAHFVAGWMQAHNFDRFFACLAVPSESVTIARRCPGPEVHVIGPLAGRLELFGWFRACLRCRGVGCGNGRCKLGLLDWFRAGGSCCRIGCGNSRCNTGLPYLVALSVVLQTLQIGMQRRLLRHLLRAAAPGPDGCKEKNSRYKKRAPNYPIRCCHVRTLNQLSSATCKAHPASPP